MKKGLGCFLKFEQPYLQQVICKDEIEQAIVDVLLGAGSEGMPPKDIAARLIKYEVSRWHVSRRLERMNKRLKKEVGQNVAERRGWKWATTCFLNENWSATKEGIKTENVVAVSDIHFEIDLEKVIKCGIEAIYEPDMFPAAICRMKTNGTILLFKNGKLVLAGSKSKRQAELMMTSMTRTLQEFGCLVAESNLATVK
jgi:hypothetical protein